MKENKRIEVHLSPPIYDRLAVDFALDSFLFDCVTITESASSWSKILFELDFVLKQMEINDEFLWRRVAVIRSLGTARRPRRWFVVHVLFRIFLTCFIRVWSPNLLSSLKRLKKELRIFVINTSCDRAIDAFIFRCSPFTITFMYKHPSNAHLHLFSHTCFFIRDRWWPLLLPSLAVVFLVFCPQASYSLQINVNDYQQANANPDRTIAKLGPRDLQEVTTSSPSFDDQRLVENVLETFVASSDASHALYVVTLDGKITAIDADANGRHLWTADTGSALIDSSLSKIEISRDSRSVRLIPSLIGGLFEKYDEDGHVEPLPFDADALLDASFKLHDELVITGGKHIDTIGLDLHTGQVNSVSKPYSRVISMVYLFCRYFIRSPRTTQNNRLAWITIEQRAMIRTTKLP